MAEGGGEDVALPESGRGEAGGKGASREGIIDHGRPRGGKKVRGGWGLVCVAVVASITLCFLMLSHTPMLCLCLH